MRRSTAILAQYTPQIQTGQTLHFANARGGYFSDREEYGLKVVGRTAQDGTPAPEAPVPIRCVKAGTKVTVLGQSLGSAVPGGEITVPCDLCEGDVWYPMTGKVVRNTGISALTESNIGTCDMMESKSYIEIMDFISGAKSGFICDPGTGYCNVFECHYNEYGTRGNYFMIYNTNRLRFPATFTRSALKDMIQNHGNITFYYPLENPIIEQYAPQPVHAPAGTVHVLQTPADLPGELSAAMLTRR